VVWTLGEIVVASVALAILADLAPAHLRGRYNGVYGLAWSLAGLAAPLLGTGLLAAGKAALWVVCAGVCVAAGAGQLALGNAIRRRAIPDTLEGPGPAPAPAVESG